MKEVTKNKTNMPEVQEAEVVETTTKNYESLLKQIKSEHGVAHDFIKPKWDKWATRLSLYNNQKKDQKAIGDVTLFTVFQTVFAQLYSDQLNATFNARGDGDEERAETWTQLAEFDYQEMEREETDYEWIWDSMFFGRGLQLLMEFDSESKTPVQEIIDPLTFLRDPRARSTQGTGKKRKGAMRFGGWHGTITKYEWEMNKDSIYKDSQIDLFGNDQDIPESDADKQVEENRKLRAAAQGTGDPSYNKSAIEGDNEEKNVLNWFTRHDGKMLYVTCTTDFSKIIRVKELPFKSFPLVDRALFPTAHDWDGVSIPDLIEDKQRARAILSNLSLQSAEFNLFNTYFYDETKIMNKGDLNREMNKHVAVKGNPQGVVVPAQRSSIGGEVQWIMSLLSNSANAAVATPAQEQGMNSERRNTATADVLIDKKVDERRSLTAKVFGWSEKKFWKQWYAVYDEYFDAEVDSKIVRVVGAFGASFKEIRKKDLKTTQHPDVVIESAEVSDSKRFNKLQSFTSYIQLIAQDPNSNLRYALKRAGELRGLKKDEVDRILPPTIDEMEAEAENAELSMNKIIKIDVNEDHKAHLEMHAKAKDTPAKEAHMMAHKRALLIRRDKPELFGEGAEATSSLNPTDPASQQVQLPSEARPVDNGVRPFAG